MSCGCGSCVSCQNLYSIPTGIPGTNGAPGANGADGVDGKGYDATSITSTNILDTQLLTVSITLQSTDKAYLPGSRVRVSNTVAPTTKYFEGTVTAYSTITGVMDINVDFKRGSGTLADWQVSLAAPLGSRVLYHNSTPAATSGTNVTDLMTYQLPFGIYSIDNFDKLRIQVVAITGANLFDSASQTANAKNLKVYFGTKEIQSVDLGVAVGGNFVKRITVDWQFTKGTGALVDQIVTLSYATDVFGSIDVQEVNLNSGLTLNESLDLSTNFPLDIKITGEATVAPEIITAELLSIDIIKG